MSEKRIIAMILGLAMMIGVLAGCGAADTNRSEDASNTMAVSEDTEQGEIVESESESTVTENQNTENEGSGKTLVVYYSAQGHTGKVANTIADELGADTFEIIPVEEYSDADLNWTNNDSRVSKEHNDTSLRDIALTTTTVEGWEEYDTVYIGYRFGGELQHGRSIIL